MPQQKRSVSDLSFIIREPRKILHHKLFFGNATISNQLQNIGNKFIRMTFNLSEENILPLKKEHALLTRL